MTKGERIEYAIKKAVSEYSFIGWLEMWDIKKEEWEKFMAAGKEVLPNDCGVMCGYAMTKEDAIGAWNMRAEARNDMNEKLKPCPFCGGEGKVFAYDGGGICVKCMTCFCQTFVVSDGNIANAKSYSAYERVTDAWNRRAEREE